MLARACGKDHFIQVELNLCKNFIYKLKRLRCMQFQASKYYSKCNIDEDV